MCWHVTIVEHTQEHKKVNFQTAGDAAQLCNSVIQRDATVNVICLGVRRSWVSFHYFWKEKLSFSEIS